MGYIVTANVTGEPARVQQENGRTVFSSRGQAEDFQRRLRIAGNDRVDIQDVGASTDEEYYADRVTAPASTPDRQAKPQSQSQVVVDVETGKNVPFRESRQAQIEENIARARIEDRKSTRLNSSHSQISYAVF